MMTAEEYYTQPDPEPEVRQITREAIARFLDTMLYGRELSEEDEFLDQFTVSDDHRCQMCESPIATYLFGDAEELSTFIEFYAVIDHQRDVVHLLCESCYEGISEIHEEEVDNC